MSLFLHKLSRRQINIPKTNDSNILSFENEQPTVTLDRHLSLTALTCLSISNSIGSGKLQLA